MSSTTADTYPESVGSCRPLTPPASPPPHPAPVAALRAAPVRRQLDFAEADAGAVAGGDLDDYNDIILSAVDDIERVYNEAKRRAPQCICGRGDCAVQRDHKRGRWMYVCPSQPKCKHVALCEEVDHVSPVHVSPQGAGAMTPVHVSAQGAGTTTPVHVSAQGAGTMTPVNVIPQAAFDTTPVHVSAQGAGTTTPVHVSAQAAGTTTPVNVIPQAAFDTTPVHVSPQGAGAVTPVHVSPQGAGTKAAVKVSPRWHRSNDGQPICQCTAGKCKISRLGNEDCYVCPIPKGQGACSFKMPVTDAIKGAPQIGDYNIMEAHGNTAVGVGDNNANGNPAQPSDDEWPIPFDIINNEIVLTGQAAPRAVVHQKSPGTPRQPIAMAKTPATSPTPFGSRSPMTGRPCYRCGEEGHWIRDCPKRRSPAG